MPNYRFMECSEPNCRFRYPAAVADRRGARCPVCGAVARVATTEIPQGVAARPPRTQRETGPEIEVLVDNVRSVYNVGSIFRTADGVGVGHLYLCGITPGPDHPRLAKTALGAEEAVPWSHHLNAVDQARALRARGCVLLALENGPDARSIYRWRDDLDLGTRPLVLLIGNEIVGVDPALRAMSHAVLMLPMEGVKESLNVATACGIALYTLRHGR